MSRCLLCFYLGLLLGVAGCVAAPNGQQAIAGASACEAHGGVKFHWGKYNRNKFLVTCMDSTEIHGVIKR